MISELKTQGLDLSQKEGTAFTLEQVEECLKQLGHHSLANDLERSLDLSKFLDNTVYQVVSKFGNLVQEHHILNRHRYWQLAVYAKATGSTYISSEN